MKKHALLIGVSDYAPDFTPLPAAARDAAAFQALLCDPRLGGFAESHVTLLKNPGRLEMEIAIESLFADRHRDDLVLFFFSGHGIKGDDPMGRLYLAARDTRKTPNGRLWTATAVAAATVHRHMEESRARRQVIVLDSCFSGAFPEGLSSKDDGKVDIRNQLGGEGRAVLTSSSALQYSFQQDDEKFSLYTRFLIQGIETGEADSNGDGIISAGEWHDYARDKVKEIRPTMAPEFYPGREGYAIHVARVPVDDADAPVLSGASGDPGEAYRQEVAYCVREGKGRITIVDRIVLDELRDELALDAATAKAMEEQVLAPYRREHEEYQQKTQRYERVFRRVLEHQGKPDETALAALRRQRERWGLREEDVEVIENRVKEELARERQQQQYEQALKVPMQEKRFLLPGELREQITQIRQELNLSKEEATQLHGAWLGSKEANAQFPGEPGQIFRDPLKDGSLGPSMIVIPAGSFLMGSPKEEAERFDDEGPQHEVTIASPFALGRGAVMVGEFRAFVEATGYRTEAERGEGCVVWNKDVGQLERRKDRHWQDPGFDQNDYHPVVGVSWNDAMVYVAWLGKQTGKEYRLPTEAEWEYAARAGTDTPFFTGECIHTDLANYNGNHDYADCGAKTGVWREKTVPVGTLPANPWGLHEVHGNVWEWTADSWHENYQDAPADGSAWGKENAGECSRRVVRGGGWLNEPRNLRSAYRYRYFTVEAENDMGFRIARAF